MKETREYKVTMDIRDTQVDMELMPTQRSLLVWWIVAMLFKTSCLMFMSMNYVVSFCVLNFQTSCAHSIFEATVFEI